MLEMKWKIYVTKFHFGFELRFINKSNLEKAIILLLKSVNIHSSLESFFWDVSFDFLYSVREKFLFYDLDERILFTFAIEMKNFSFFRLKWKLYVCVFAFEEMQLHAYRSEIEFKYFFFKYFFIFVE